MASLVWRDAMRARARATDDRARPPLDPCVVWISTDRRSRLIASSYRPAAVRAIPAACRRSAWSSGPRATSMAWSRYFAAWALDPRALARSAAALRARRACVASASASSPSALSRAARKWVASAPASSSVSSPSKKRAAAR